MTSLSGKIIVVTGAGRGLGRAFAEGAAQAGAAAVVVAELVDEWGRATVAALTKSGHESMFVALDLGDPASVAAMAEAVGRRYGRID
ncbi:MAG TPA: SDR family NAD(P)-dependent oxidoreductase, partial [Alphaproteobacteria bacterium]